jgi:two-component system nitrate/nitrite response regulator NarL
MIRVTVVDGHPLYREGLVTAIERDPRLALCGAFSDGFLALDAMRRSEPDVALLDVRTPNLDGFELLAALASARTRVALVSARSDGALIHDALTGGAAGFLSKCAEPEEICSSIVKVADGRTVLSPQHSKGLAEYVRFGSCEESLSSRELQALTLIATGLSTNAIAERLSLSAGTVKCYLARAYDKLGAPNRAAAIAEAMRRGLLV